MKTTSELSDTSNYLRYLSYICAGIIALLPFHAFLTVWAASLVGHYTLLRLWKEVLLALLVIVVACDVVRRRRYGLVRGVVRRPLLLVIGVYLALLVVAGGLAVLLGGVSPKAALYGLLLDGRYLVFFGIVWYVASHDGWLSQRWRHIFLTPFAIVAIIGLLQFAVFPPDVLRHFGYGPDTIAATQTIDQKAGYQRIQSTLRGANPLGAYAVVGIVITAQLILRERRRLTTGLLLVAAVTILALTFSRSAWLGALAALGWTIWQLLRSARARRLSLVLAGLVIVVAGSLGYGLRHNDQFQNTFLHTDEHSTSSKSSNQGHLDATRQGVRDVIARPWGSGTGSAGPASVYNSGHPVRIAENYYVQIGQEIGVLGLGVWLVIVGLVGRELWYRRDQTLATALLASLIGISVIGLLSHVWTDDTLAYVWWGLAGIALASPSRRPALAATRL